MKVWTEAELIELERSVCYPWLAEYQISEVRQQVRELIAIARAHGYVMPIPPMPPRNAEPVPVPSAEPKHSKNPPPGWKKKREFLR